MRVIIDTNVSVSGVFWSGLPESILQSWVNKEFDLIVTDEIVEEYQDVLWRVSIKFNKTDVNRIIKLVSMYAINVKPVAFEKPVCRDPDDDKFLTAAVAANAPVIVSGDKDLLVLNPYKKVSILTPRDFVNQYQHVEKETVLM